MRKRLATAAIASLLMTAAAGIAFAAEPGSGLSICAKCTTSTLVSMTGAGTAQAKAVAEVTQGDVDEWCDNFIYDETPKAECKARGDVPGGTLGERLVSSADCRSGRIIDADGKGYKAVGTWRGDEEAVGYAEGRIKFRSDDGQIEPGVGAANGVSLAVNFSMMCPAGLDGVKTASTPKLASASGPAVVDLSSVDGRLVFDHNGSGMYIDREKGLIVYETPKDSIRKAVKPGQVLFRGRIPEKGKISGTAYVFKAGCAPAPYTVSGRFANDDMPVLILTGAAPKRSKTDCSIIGTTTSGGNSTLKFTFIGSP